VSSDKDLREVTHMCRYPGQEHSLVVGGFNGELQVFDARKLTAGPLRTAKVADGGLWRIAAKRFGPACVKFAIATCSENRFVVLDDTQDFAATTSVASADGSWAYGIDWSPAPDSRVLLACSFYDRSTHLFAASP